MTMTVTDAPSSSSTTQRQRHVVMIDDDRSEHALLVMAAEEAGLDADFEFFDDGAEALLHLQDRDAADLPDVIVLDLRMPGLDGHRTLDELQTHPLLSDVPVVVFTSSPRPVDRRESVDRGAVSFSLKPSDFEGMVAFARSLADPDTVEAPSTPDARLAEARELRRLAAKTVHDEVDDYLRRHGYLDV